MQLGAAKKKSPFDGWQLAILTLTIAWGTAVLVVPRGVAPTGAIPDPVISPRSALAIAQRDSELAASVTSSPLSSQTRALGSEVRRFGREEARADKKAMALAKDAIDEAARKTPTADEVLRLRAYQTEVFVRALREWEASGTRSVDLIELGGTFIDLVDANHWFEIEGKRRIIAMSDLARRASFKDRWNGLTGVSGNVFELTSDERRAMLGFSIRHPARPAGISSTLAGQLADQVRLKKVDELAKLDDGYPVHFAKGILQYRLGEYPRAVQEFGSYIEERHNEPYAVRAANHMRAALDADVDQ